MEALLPSEIARLVLGYLEDQKCTDAAKLFLETSPHLQECRTVLSHGRRFSTRVNGLTLIDVVEKLSAINAMIQERLNKVTDCEQLKHCGDLIEQLKFLVEEPRGQRFVVNINVPSQSNTQTSNGLPIITCNMRKRRHSNSERIKRIIKPQSNATQQSDVIMSLSANNHNIDTTPLESLPGNIETPLQQAECSTVEKRDENVSQESHKQCDFDKNNSESIVHNRNNIRISSDDISSIQSCEVDIDDKKREESGTANIIPKRYTTATSTEELLSFSSTEVQTIPYEIHESESESNDEPIENLSILTKEILNRTDLQECIAENINKAIIPTDISLKDENLNESVEGNTSIMAELNSAIKSIVEATESDPVFEKFLDEIIGPHTETDTSPEEDGEGKLSPKSINEPQEQQGEPVLSNINSPEPMITDVRVPAENDTTDVPLKHRLRSSSRQQCNRIEDEVDKVRDQEKEQSVLEDQNAAAILSIINANITNNTSENNKRILDDPKESIITNDNNKQTIQTVVSTLNKNDISSTSVKKSNDIVPSTTNTGQSKVRKPTVKRPRATKPKRDQGISNNQPLTEQEIMTMPTLILCSKEEVNNLLINRSSTIKSSSRFIPIAPKDSNKIKETMETLYLKTVNVAQKLPIVTTQPVIVEEDENNFANQTVSQGKNSKISKELKTVHKIDTTVPATIINQQIVDQPQIIESTSTDKIAGDESITLYGNETSAKTLLDGTSMPTINLDENISMSESGLSPYLKFNCSKTSQSHNLSDIDLAPVMENAKKRSADNDGTEKQQSPNADIIAKRTPKSLLRSRSKNHRLSLSTPRKRSSHVRALDFSTPTISSARKTNGEGNNNQFLSASTKRLKSVCRTSLFRSPSLSNTSIQKQKSPMKVCQPYRIPIATRSPAPKLMGGWDKYNGVGVIIGEVSPHGSASCSSSEDKTVHKFSKALTDSWDADLRKSIQLNKKDEVVTKKSAKRRDSIKDDVHMNAKYSPRSTKSKNKRKTGKIDKKSNHNTENIEENETEENSQDNVYHAAAITKSENNEENVKAVINTADSTTNKLDKVLKSASTCETSAEINSTSILNNNTVTEKKPIKKYAQLKTITTNLKKSDDEMKKKTEDAQISEISRTLSVDSTQHICSILRLPDMISLETPRKFDNISGPPPTPRVLSPSNIITPFIKSSEDSSKIRSFITTPEFPITPCVALTPKEETTRDIIKKGEYNSPYYKPKSEQVQDSELSKLKDSSIQESPIISSSHLTLHSTHNSLTSGNTYQTSSKLEITQFEVIKENLPREEAIKELKIASNSKDSEFNASIVVDRHIDLIEVNEFKDVKENEINNDNYVADSHNNPHNDSVESNSSSSSNTSSSSSSSSTSSSNTDTSTSGSSNCDKAQSKTSTDSNDFAEKGINASKSKNDDQLIDIPIDTKPNNDLIEQESSPQKVFAIAKTDDQIEATMKETPAKDETLLNEADISETPSSSKSGMEHFTNLSTKISAIITEDEKLSKANKHTQHTTLPRDKIQMNKLKAKPKIISMQHIRSGSKIVIEPIKSVKDNYRPEQDKVMQQLEEKRQRMIAKIKDTSKANLSKVTKRKCISNALKKIGREQRKILPVPKCSLKTNANKDVNKNAKCEGNPSKISTINTRKRYQQQKLNVVHKCCNNEEDSKKDTKSKNAASNLTNCGKSSNKPLNDHTKKQSYKSNICNAENNLVKNQSEESKSLQSYKNSSSENQEYLKEKSNVKNNTEKSCSMKSNIIKEEGEELQDNTKNAKSSEQEMTSTEKYVQNVLTVDKAKQEIRDPEDKMIKLRQVANYPDKSFKISRYKVDQVKRDLFSDEECDHKLSSTISVKDNKEVVNMETENLEVDLIEVPSKEENVNPENSKELSSVLQCLQLVPAYKNENLHNGENQIEQHQEQSEHKNKDNVNNELQQAANIHNYKAEYHFVHDDSAPIRKRRRRYSGHELQIEINHADVSDPNISSPIECIRIMRASDFEEIFNLAPKSKKRAISKRSPTKNDKGNEIDKDAFILKDNAAKPLATSSPVDKPPTDKLSKTKLKKMITKTATTNKTDINTQSEAKKKQKFDKEKVSDTTAKSRKRKLSETKETKQVEKKPCTVDPQMLLSNMNKEDLDNLLDKVHGPV